MYNSSFNEHFIGAIADLPKNQIELKLIPALALFGIKKISSKIGPRLIIVLRGVGSCNEAPILRIDSQYIDGLMRDEVGIECLTTSIDGRDFCENKSSFGIKKHIPVLLKSESFQDSRG